MSEFFNSKDYGEYFRELEARAEAKPEGNKADTPHHISSLSPRKHISSSKPSHRRCLLSALVICILAAVSAAAIPALLSAGKKSAVEAQGKAPSAAMSTYSAAASQPALTVPEDTPDPGSNIISENVLMIDLESGKAVAARNADQRAYPASTTKIMTALVAAEHITDYSETFKMTLEITDKVYLAEATAAGFLKDEEVTMTDLLYGTILPSGGDAALGLAFKISGSEEAFVELMNQKAAELGLKGTHFTNVTGLFDKNHYTTASDLAVITKAAMDNPVCKQVLSTHPYTTAKTAQHPNGILLESTLFSSMYGTEPETATITGGKTGYVNESGYCIASFGSANETKNRYICITLNAKGGKWPSINDQIALYKTYAK